MRLKFKVVMKSIVKVSGSVFGFTYVVDCYSDGPQITSQRH